MRGLENQGSGETRARSFAKTISWRVIATGITFGFAYLWLGSVTESAGLALLANGVKGIIYYGHERVWNGLNWGRTAPAGLPVIESNGHAPNLVEIDQSDRKALASTELVNETWR